MVSPVFPAVDFSRLLPPQDTANTDQVRGLVPQAPPNVGVDEALQNRTINRPFGQVLSVNTVGENNFETRTPAQPPLGENPNFIRPAGSILSANTLIERGIELQVQPSIRRDRFEDQQLRDLLFNRESQQQRTQSLGLTETPPGSVPQGFLSRPNPFEVSGFDQGDRVDPRTQIENPNPIASTDTQAESSFFDFLLEPESRNENRSINDGDERAAGSRVTPQRAEAEESFVDFEALLNRTDVNARLATTPGENFVPDQIALAPGTPVQQNQEPAEPEFQLDDNIIDREPTFAFERNLIEQADRPVPGLFDLNQPGALQPAAPSPDDRFQQDLRTRETEVTERTGEQERPTNDGERFQNPNTGLIDGGFPLIGTIASRLA